MAILITSDKLYPMQCQCVNWIVSLYVLGDKWENKFAYDKAHTEISPD